MLTFAGADTRPQRRRLATTARKARARQAATGEKYTTALRATATAPEAPEASASPVSSPLAVLAAALHAIGEHDAAARLDENVRIAREGKPLSEALDRASEALWRAERVPAAVRAQLEKAERDAADTCVKWYEQYQDQAEYYAAYVALCRAGERADGQQLARAACDVLGGPELDMGHADQASDEIRGMYAGGWPGNEDMRDLTGPDTPQAGAARQAAALLYEARHTPTGDDIYWTHAAELVIKAAGLADLAASLPGTEPCPGGGTTPCPGDAPRA